jgi:hypothetical protein
MIRFDLDLQSLMVVQMMPRAVITFMRWLGRKCQVALEPGCNRLIRIGGCGDQNFGTTLSQTQLQTTPGTICNEQRNTIQWMWRNMITVGKFMKALVFFQLDHDLADHRLALHFIDPEFAAHAGVFGDCFAVLAGDGNLHGRLSANKLAERWRCKHAV